jgi:outer membrane protein OmpA-like peptidoglycan-associated protein
VKALLALALLTGAAQDATDNVRFITCPIYRDTDSGKKSGCWLAEDRATGRRYDVSLSISKPDWNHEVLVEGRPAATTDNPCGGVVLDAVRTSILPGECTRQMLPAESYMGRKFVLPKRNVRPIYDPAPPPAGPYGAKSFHLLFDFDQAFLIYQYDDFYLDRMIAWIRAAKPRGIAITGYAATAPSTVSGRVIAENPAIARVRAEKIADALVRLGVDRRIITVRWHDAATPLDVPEADGLIEPSRRRVDVDVTP